MSIVEVSGVFMALELCPDALEMLLVIATAPTIAVIVIASSAYFVVLIIGL